MTARHLPGGACGLVLLLWLAFPQLAGAEGAPADLSVMSLEDLSKVQVTSVSKSSEVLQRAPAAVYVISHEDIVRSGATSVPEVLRLAPNLLIIQTGSNSYVISARGFGGNPTSQNFSNKLLILIDGRSVYTPLFSGIYANTLDVMLEDIERIEVISGVGATLWGALLRKRADEDNGERGSYRTGGYGGEPGRYEREEYGGSVRTSPTRATTG